jgi:putative MATE family efflux protein
VTPGVATGLAPQLTASTAEAIVAPAVAAAAPAGGAAAPAGGQPPRSARTRLLLEGPIVRTLLRLGAPNVVVNVVLIAVTASVDAHFVGQLGPGALAGLALVFPVVMLMQQMANGNMGGAIASAIARAVGAGRRDDAGALVVHGVVIALAMAALFTTALLAGGPALYRLLGGRGEMLAVAAEYSTVIFAGAAAFWVLGALTSAVRGAGQAAILAGVYLAAEALHVLLVPALVFGVGPLPPLGATGAALATVTSFTASAIALAWYVASGRTGIALSPRSLRLDRRLFVEILRVGAPSSLTPILGNLTLAVLTGYVATLGPAAVAGFGAAVRLEYVQVPVTFGLGVGVLAMVGTSIGAGQLGRAARVAWTAAGLAMAATASFSVLALGWPDAWIGLFSADAAVHAAGARVLGVVGFTYPFLGLGFALAYAFQAAGRPLCPLLAIVCRVLVAGAGGWIAIHWTQSGLVGLAIVAAAGLVASGSILAFAFRAGAWRPDRSASIRGSFRLRAARSAAASRPRPAGSAP